jgi:phosphopantetheine adenylyltransferase
VIRSMCCADTVWWGGGGTFSSLKLHDCHVTLLSMHCTVLWLSAVLLSISVVTQENVNMAARHEAVEDFEYHISI